MKLKFVKTHPDAKIPTKAYPDDHCYDLYAVSEEEIATNVWKYGFGLAFELEKGHVYNPRINYALKIYPRSSIWKTGMILSNYSGIIDEGYRNEISAVFYHVMPNMPRYEKGQKIAQLCIEASEDVEFVEVEELGDSARGLKGYGSSGK